MRPIGDGGEGNGFDDGKGRRTAADLFREIEPLDDTSAEEMLQAIKESRENARKLEAAQEPPEL